MAKIEIRKPDWKQEYLKLREEVILHRARADEHEADLQYIALLEDENRELKEQLKAVTKWQDDGWM